jgi:PAB-dependent poly(A)-specific ribonuclease subunit 2
MQNRRMIKLRFLASYILAADIQTETHCSLEDAFTALRLYHRYVKLTQDGKFEETLTEIYNYGKAHNWETVTMSNTPSLSLLSTASLNFNKQPDIEGVAAEAATAVVGDDE